MAKLPKVDPYPDYRDGNCRDVSGQIIPCGSEFVVSRPKWPEDAPAKDEQDDEDGA